MSKIETGKERLDKFEYYKSSLDTWKSRVQKICKYVSPTRWNLHEPINYPTKQISNSAGSQKTTQVYDATAISGAIEFASNLQTIILPPFKRWMNLGISDDAISLIGNNIDIKQSATIELESTTKILFDKIRSSNFDQVIHESFQDLFIGTAFLAINESNDPRAPFYLTSIPINDVVFGIDEVERISDIWRFWNIPISNVAKLWKNIEFPDRLKRLLQTSPLEYIQLIEGAMIYKDNKPEQRCYYYVQEYGNHNDLLSEWREYSPFMGYRYSKSPGEQFGRGPADLLFPWIKELNLHVEMQLRSERLQALPIYMVSAQNVINSQNISLYPGALISVSETKSGMPPIQTLPAGGSPQLLSVLIKELREMISSKMFANPLGQVGQTPQMTATEINLRYQDYIRRNGSAVGRLTQELIYPLVEKMLLILIKKGMITKNLNTFPAISLTLNGKNLTLNYNSPLVSIQDKEDVEAFKTCMGILVELVGQNAIVSIKPEDLPLWLFKKLGADSTLLQTPMKVREIVQRMMELASQQAQPPKTGIPATPSLPTGNEIP